jgi:hypothetical protein
MKRTLLFLCVLALAVTCLPAKGGPATIECVSFKVGTETIWIPFGEKIPVEQTARLQAATVRAAHQYMLDGGDMGRGHKMVQAAMEQSCGDSAGALCIAYQGPWARPHIVGCAIGCNGMGCCTIKATIE